MSQMCEYDVYVPLNYNNGMPIEDRKLAVLREQLIRRLGGLTVLAVAEGYWNWNGRACRDFITIYRVLANASFEGTRQFFRELRTWLKKELEQEEILITCRQIEIVEPIENESKVSQNSINPIDEYNNGN